MTKTYPIRSRSDLIVRDGLIGAGFTVAAGVVLGGMWHWAVGVAVSAAICVGAWLHYGSTTYEIRVTEEGVVEFVRLWRSLRVPAHAILAVEGVWDVDEHGQTSWDLLIEHGRPGRWIPLDRFPGVEEFVAEVRRLNPAIEHRGVGPRGPRPGPWL